MPLARFPYFEGLPTALLAFHPAGSGPEETRRLLVDSGFTGASAFVLSTDDAQRLRRRSAPSSEISGALLGAHERVWVRCSIPSLGYQASVIAIASDLASLALPPGIDGLVGLSFLGRFRRWGAEQSGDGNWEFVLDRE
jgi:hypothetical protein